MYTTMVTDLRWTCPNNDLARRAAAALHSPVYRYVVTHTPSGPVDTSAAGGLLSFPSRFSFHMLDAVTFFGNLESLLKKTFSVEDKAFQQLLTQQLVNFAKEGKMTDQWSEYPTAIALLSHDLSVVHNDSAFHCQLWQDRGFYPYAVIN